MALGFQRRYKAVLASALAAVLLIGGAAAAHAEPYGDSLESVVNYLPAERQAFVGSPTLEVLSDGTYIAAHNRFGSGADSFGETNHRFTEVFRSDDKGQTWTRASVVEPLFWATVFELDGALYLMGIGSQVEHGPAVIYRSDDRGTTWSAPTTILPGTYHTGDTPVLIHEGRIYKTFEQHMGGGWGQYEALVVSAAIGDDLLDPASWTRTNNTDLRFTLEGNPIVTPDGDILNILRWHYHQTEAMVTRLVDEDTLEIVGPTEFPRGVPVNKFYITRDEQTGTYLMVGSPETETKLSGLSHHRNVLALYESEDALHWRFVKVLVADDQGYEWEQSVRRAAFSQPTIQIDGDDLLLVSRTAYGEADSNHNTNRLTFHRFPQFRTALGQGDLVAHFGFDDAADLGADLSPSGGTEPVAIVGTAVSGTVGGAFAPQTGGMDLGYALHPTLWDATGLSAAAWTSLSAAPSSSQVLFQTKIHAALTGFEMALTPAGLRVEVRPKNDVAPVVRTVPYPFDGQWHHVAASADLAAGTLSVYVDGVEVNAEGRAVSFGNADYRVGVPAEHDRIGSATYGAAFGGSMDELRVYRTALTATEIAELAAPTAPALSGITVDGAGLPGFNPEASVVRARVDGAATVELQTASGTVAQPATVAADPAPGETEAHEIVLTSGERSRTVTLLIERPLPANSSVELSKVQLSDGRLLPLTPGVRDYDVALPTLVSGAARTLSIVAVLPTHPRATATIVAQPDTAQETSTAIIRTTAEDGTVEDTRIHVNVQRTDVAGHWQLDGPGPVFPDATPFGNHARGSGVVSVPGRVGGAAGLDAAAGSGLVLGSELAGILRGSQAITVAGWVKRAAAGTGENNWIFGSRVNAGGAGIDLLFDGADIRMAGRSQAADGYQRRAFPYPNDGEWHHVAAILDIAGDQIRMYIDGQPVASNDGRTVSFGATSYQPGQPSQPDAIGMSPAQAGRFTGALDDIAVWGVALTAEQIGELATYEVLDETLHAWAAVNGRVVTLTAVGAASGIEYAIGDGAWETYVAPLTIAGVASEVVRYRAVGGEFTTGPVGSISVAAQDVSLAADLVPLGTPRTLVVGERAGGLGARLVDVKGAGVVGADVEFTVVGGVFVGGGTSASASTNAAGIAAAPAVTSDTPSTAVVTAHAGARSVALPEVAFVAPALPLDADVSVATPIVSGKVVLTVTVKNTGQEAADIKVTSRFGTKKFTAVAPGSVVVAEIKTVAAIPAGSVGVTLTGPSGITTITETYAAAPTKWTVTPLGDDVSSSHVRLSGVVIGDEADLLFQIEKDGVPYEGDASAVLTGAAGIAEWLAPVAAGGDVATASIEDGLLALPLGVLGHGSFTVSLGVDDMERAFTVELRE